MGTSIASTQVTDQQLSQYAKLVYKVVDIRISPQKKTLLSNRIRRRLRETGIPNFEAYYRHISRLKLTDPEWDAFLQEITTHETYLFRDEAQWVWFQKIFLSEIASAAAAGERPKSLRIWSTACSTGDEVFTVAACIAASLPNYSQWNIHILGTDIGIGALEQAGKAEFRERAMRLVKDDIKRRFFDKSSDGQIWTAKPILKEMAEFRQHNLLEPFRQQPFDLVLLKNVLIYFDIESKKTTIGHVGHVLKPGGHFICGAAEGVSDLMAGFQRLDPWLYRKQ